MFCKKGALKYLAKLTGKHVHRSVFFKVSRCRPEADFKKRLVMHRDF